MPIVKNGLIAYWHYRYEWGGNTWGNIAPDTRGRFTASTNNSPSWTENGIEFWGSNDQRAVAEEQLTFPRDAITVDFYARRTSDNLSTLVDIHSSVSRQFLVKFRSDGAVRARMEDTTISSNDSNTRIPVGQFFHGTVTYDSPTLKIYINGQLDSTFSISSASRLEFSQHGFNTHIGVHRELILIAPAWVDHLHGTVKYLRIYNRALTQEEIMQNEAVSPDRHGLENVYQKMLADSLRPSERQTEKAVIIHQADDLNISKNIEKRIDFNIADKITLLDNKGKKTTFYKSETLNLSEGLTRAVKLFQADQMNMAEEEVNEVTKEICDIIQINELFNTKRYKLIRFKDGIRLTGGFLKAIQMPLISNITLSENNAQKSNIEVLFYDLVLTTDRKDIHRDRKDAFIYPIRLCGEREVVIYLEITERKAIYLTGEREPEIALRGDKATAIPLKGEHQPVICLHGKKEVLIRWEVPHMPTDKQDFSMVAGDSKQIIITLSENIEGSTAKWVLKRNVDAEEKDILKTTEDGIEIKENTITIRLYPEDTINLHGSFIHECEITDQNGNVSTVTRGSTKIDKTAI